MAYYNLTEPEFGEWPHPNLLQKVIADALDRGFDPRGVVYELMPFIEDDLAKLKAERGFTYTLDQINYKLHEMVSRMRSEEIDYISLDRSNRIYQRHRNQSRYYRGCFQTPCRQVVNDREYELCKVGIDDDEAEWRVFKVPAADWTDDDYGLIEARGEALFGVKRDGLRAPAMSMAESLRWQKG